MTLTIHNYIHGLVESSDDSFDISRGRFASIDGRMVWIINPKPEHKLPLALALTQIRSELTDFGDLIYRDNSCLEKLRRKVQEYVQGYDRKYCFLTQLINFIRYGSVNRNARAIFEWIDCHSRNKLMPLEEVFGELKASETESDLIELLVQNDVLILKSFEELKKHREWVQRNQSFIDHLWDKVQSRQTPPHFWHNLLSASEGILDEEDVRKKYYESVEKAYPEYYHFLRREKEGVVDLGNISSDVELLLKDFINSNKFPEDVSESRKNDLRSAAERFKMVALVNFCDSN